MNILVFPSCKKKLGNDLQVMSLASYQLLHSAIFLICGCKGTAIFRDIQIFPHVFLFLCFFLAI